MPIFFLQDPGEASSLTQNQAQFPGSCEPLICAQEQCPNSENTGHTALPLPNAQSDHGLFFSREQAVFSFLFQYLGHRSHICSINVCYINLVVVLF